ncbi:SAM-dependent methyltransferase [Microbispora corallina]|uniref:S-adenosyl methyltransferase n=1 Tax=Microbispora corallina TaxID=83302 RepID=A0ABQ4GAC5_9ACTN|nr:SAM-dependent methyltransferase [Microbispora corallina]GIH44030.1 hypothetical protein Mco01_70300 [Microbispora corallina]
MPGFTSVEPAGFDPAVANEARVYDYWLGGKNNFAADREAAERAIAIAPELPMMCREGRRFLGRVVRFLAASGIRQFVDIGCGLPTQGSVHEIARECAPDVTVVYADNDPVVVSHGQALLKDDERTAVIRGDLRDPDTILDHPDLRRLVDLDRPVAVLLISVLNVISDDDLVAAVTARLREAIAPGSYLAVSHAVSDIRPETTARLAALFQDARLVTGSRRPQVRSRAEVEPLFGDLEIVEPGIVQVMDWRPDPGSLRPPSDKMWVLGGVGRKKAARSN